MKLGVGYSIFNGLELLENSINQIESEIDVLLICWQKVSNKGNESKEIEEFVKNLNCNTLEFTPNLSKSTKQNELDKHNLMLDYFRNKGCTHFMLSATDHYFKLDEFKKAKEISKNYDATFVNMFSYYKLPTWQLTPIEDYLMLFISKIYPNTNFINRQFELILDPSLKLSTFNNWYLFEQEEIMMHHYTMIREDIESKFNNAAASMRWTKEMISQFTYEYNNAKVGSEISYFKGRKLIEVPNYFNI